MSGEEAEAAEPTTEAEDQKESEGERKNRFLVHTFNHVHVAMHYICSTSNLSLVHKIITK